jgi:hypothetical protein
MITGAHAIVFGEDAELRLYEPRRPTPWQEPTAGGSERP